LSLGLATFGLSVHPAPGTTIVQIEAAVAEQLNRLLDGGVTAEEVERAQNRLLAGSIYAQDSLASGPRLYAYVLTTGGTIADIDDWPQRLASVGADDVVAAARHVWREESAVTSLLTSAEGGR
jgi:zinc protease